MPNNKYKYKNLYTNLQSNIDIKYNNEIISLLIGSLLGDGYARLGYNNIKGTGTAFTFAQSSKYKEYIFYLYEICSKYNLCTDNLPKLINIDGKSSKYVFYTKKQDELDILYHTFYKKYDNKYIKGLYNKELIYKYFNELSLAIWLMDDGTNNNGHVKFCTDSFILEDVLFLQYLLYSKYNIETSLHIAGNKIKEVLYNNSNPLDLQKKDTKVFYNKEQYRIYVKANSMPILIELVESNIISSMKYKLGNKYIK